MTERLMSILAYLVLLGFLGILLYRLPRGDLSGVILLTLLLAGWDFFGPKKKS